MAINNLLDLHQAIRQVCPIDGVAGDGEIWFQENATEAQKAAAREVLANFQDSEPPNTSQPQMAPPLPPPKSIFEP